MIAAFAPWIQHSSSDRRQSMRWKKVKGQYHYGIIKDGKQEKPWNEDAGALAAQHTE